MKNNASVKKPSEEKEKVDESALVEAKIDDAVVDEVADQIEGAAEGEASTPNKEEKPNAEVGDGNKKPRAKGGKNITSDEVRNRC
jgi:hypothetical protein